VDEVELKAYYCEVCWGEECEGDFLDASGSLGERVLWDGADCYAGQEGAETNRKQRKRANLE